MYIDQNTLYRQTESGLQIFKHYFPNYEYDDPRAKFSLRGEKDDKTASAQINYYKGLWRITDFGNQSEVNSLPGINFVMYYENLVYIDALRFIQDVIVGKKITSGDFKRPLYSAKYSWCEVTKKDNKGDYNFIYKKKPTDKDLLAIGRYVDAELLKRYYGKSVEKYSFVGYSKKLKKDVVHIFEATDDYPIFVFDYGDFQKLYKPHELNKAFRFLYIGEKPKNFIYGLDQLQESDNEFINDDEDSAEPISPPKHKPDAIVKDLFKCSGESDSLNMASLGYHVYWLNSESAKMTYDDFTCVDDLCENHYQLMDLDNTGHTEAMKFALQHINVFTVYLPEFLKKKNDWRGNSCKDIKDFINIIGKDTYSTQRKVEQLKRTAMPIKFWHKNYNDKTKEFNYNINLEYFYHFLKAHGFYTMDSKYHRRAGYCYARVQGKVIDLIHPDDIKKMVKRFTKEWVRSKGLNDEIAILNKLNSSNQISEGNLQELSEFKPEFVNCDKSTEYIHFKNGSIKISNNEIKKVKHSELKNSILGRLEINDKVISQLIDRNIRVEKKPAIEVNATPEYQKLLDQLQVLKNTNKIDEREKINTTIAKFPEIDRYQVKINDEDFIFARFLKDLAHLYWREQKEKGQKLTEKQEKEQNLALVNLLFVLGWSCSEYKDPGQPWIVFLQDMKISQVGQSSGRSGKSLYSLAIGYVRNSFYVGGRRKDITDKTEFIYDGFTRFHNNIEIDDLFEYADFNFFYTQASGKREINSKFISKQVLDYKDSGKLLVSSNYEIQNTDSSTLARLLNAGVSDYYHEATKHNDYIESRSPLTQFGKRLYDDFTDEEWIKFYNIIAYSIQLQMRFNKIQPPMANLEKRQLRREMTKGLGKGEEFLNWANTYFVLAPDTFTEDYSPENCGYYNRLTKKQTAYDDFCKTITSAQASKYKAGQFKKSLQDYCQYYGFTFNPLTMCGSEQNRKARRIMKNNVEYFYISTIKESTDQPSDDLPF